MAPRQNSRRCWSPLASAVAVALAAVLTVVTPAYTSVPDPIAVGLATRQLDLIREAPVDLSAAAARVEPAVVQIDTTLNYEHVIGTGTGVVLDPGGEVLTNYHVVAGADTINATNVGTGQRFPADLVGYDRRSDIALLQLRGAGGLPTAPIGDSGQLVVGDPVVSIGNAGGTGSAPTHETGKVSGLDRQIAAEDDLTGSKNQLTGLIEVAADVRPGDSGGPLVDGAGQVVGVTTAATVNYRLGPAGAGFAIPIGRAMSIAGQIRSHTPSSSVHIGPSTILGVGVSTSPSRSNSTASGVLVRDVLHGAPAEQAGLTSGDVITALDGTPLDSATTLTYVLDRHYPGDIVTLEWIDRSGQPRNAKVTLASA
jgi:serine protease Do